MINLDSWAESQGILENLVCPHCGAVHYDIDVWATKLHRTHLCLECNQLFEGSIKGVSNPRFTSEYMSEKLCKLDLESLVIGE